MVRVATWNVNSLRSLLHYHPYSQARDDLAPLFDEHLGADIVCLQETKLSLPASLASASSSSSSSSLASAASSSSSIPRHLAMVKGYDAFFSCCKSRGGYSGVATYVRRGVLTPLAVEA
jgi:exonuclease III